MLSIMNQQQQDSSKLNNEYKKNNSVEFNLRQSQEERELKKQNSIRSIPWSSYEEKTQSLHISHPQQDFKNNTSASEINSDSSQKYFRPSLPQMISTRSIVSSELSMHSEDDSCPGHSSLVNPSSVSNSFRSSFARRNFTNNYSSQNSGRTNQSTRSLALLERADQANMIVQSVIESHHIALISPDECVLCQNAPNELAILGEGSFGRVVGVSEIRLRKRKFHRRQNSNSRLSTLTKIVLQDSARSLNCNSDNDDVNPKLRESSTCVYSTTSIRTGASNHKPSLRRNQSFVSLKVDENRKTLVDYLNKDKDRTCTDKSSTNSTSEDADNMSSLASYYSTSDVAEEEQQPYCFAMKKCKHFKDYEPRAEAAIDIATEACLLADLSHENIVKLHAMSTRPVLSSGFFILLEYLPVTLQNKWLTWKKTHKRNCLRIFGTFGSTAKSHLLERIEKVGVGVASALSYLHSKKIIYRDIKRDNIGFAPDGTVKIFDFGLSSELDVSVDDHTTTFRLTRVGAPRYMAPEVIAHREYNRKADVYSYSILFWEICSLHEAFKGMSCNQHFEQTLKGKVRPVIKRWWPTKLRRLFPQIWHADFRERPSFDMIGKDLRALSTQAWL